MRISTSVSFPEFLQKLQVKSIILVPGLIRKRCTYWRCLISYIGFERHRDFFLTLPVQSPVSLLPFECPLKSLCDKWVRPITFSSQGTRGAVLISWPGQSALLNESHLVLFLADRGPVFLQVQLTFNPIDFPLPTAPWQVLAPRKG